MRHHVYVAIAARRQPEKARRGKITKLDLEPRLLSLVFSGKDEEFKLTEDTIVLGVPGNNLRDRFGGIKGGAEVCFTLPLSCARNCKQSLDFHTSRSVAYSQRGILEEYHASCGYCPVDLASVPIQRVLQRSGSPAAAPGA